MVFAPSPDVSRKVHAMADTQRAALEQTVASDPKLAQPRHSALVNLCRMLADQIDEAGPKASTHLTAAYLSALKDLRRAMGEESGKDTASGKLAQLRSVQAKQPAKSTRRRAS